MARIRSVKPETWSDQKLARLSRDARLLYISLWNFADEQGRVVGDPRQVKGMCLPMDDDLGPKEIDALLDELADIGRIVRYAVDDEHFLFLPHLSKHQRLDSGQDSRLPAPPDDDPAPTPQNSGDSSDKSGEDSGQFGEVQGDPGEVHPRARAYVAGSREQVAGSRGVVAIRPDIEQLCELLADGVQITTGERPKVNKRWHDACRLLLDTDGYAPQQVEALIRWSQTDEFWRSNILSMPKLREKRLQLIAQMQRPTRTTRSRSQRQVDQARQTYEEMMADATGGVGGDRRPPQPELARPADYEADR